MKNILFLFLLLYSNLIFAQKDPIKWGKVSQEEVDIQVVAFDSSAKAVVLCDYGRIYAQQSDGVTFRRHVRIKILDDGAKEHADIAIPYYHKNGNEKITYQTAQTINVENGKPKKTALSKKEFYKVKKNENWSELRFTFPDVKKGSIIEYSYSVDSKNFMNLETWYFQDNIPTLKSQFYASIDGTLDYKILYQGRYLIEKYGGKSVNTWELTNLPAIKDEPFCPNPFDYTEKIRFQLAAYLTNIGKEKVMGTWKDVATDLYAEGGLKQYLKQNKDAKSIVSQIISDDDNEQDKIQKIYNYVVNNYVWNNKYRMFTNATYKEFKSKSSGSSAEINLFLINLLQAAGLTATPTLVSTKRHGKIARHITFYTQFDHLIVAVKLDQKDILIDGTNKYRPYNLLDEEDLNFEALVLDKKEPYFLDITPYKKSKNVKLINMEIPEPGKVKYKYELNAKGYDALEIREYLEGSKTKVRDYFNKRLIKQNTEYNIQNISSKNLEDPNKSVYLSADIIDNTASIVNDDFIYISPFVDRYQDANPFNDKDRYLPIDFYHPFEEAYVLNFKIPEGYEVVEYPDKLNVATEDNKGVLNFSASLKGDNLQLRISFSIKEPFFTAYEYPVLREIYDRYIEKREEQIVLKRNNYDSFNFTPKQLGLRPVLMLITN